jgi:hypothetical protein
MLSGEKERKVAADYTYAGDLWGVQWQQLLSLPGALLFLPAIIREQPQVSCPIASQEAQLLPIHKELRSFHIHIIVVLQG